MGGVLMVLTRLCNTCSIVSSRQAMKRGAEAGPPGRIGEGRASGKLRIWLLGVCQLRAHSTWKQFSYHHGGRGEMRCVITSRLDVRA